MNFNNFTQGQKESFWIILVLLAFAIVTFSGAGLLFSSYSIIAMLLFFCGLFLTALACVGYYIEFVEKPRDDKKYKD